MKKNRKYRNLKIIISIILLIISVLCSFETRDKGINEIKLSKEITKSNIAPFKFKAFVLY